MLKSIELNVVFITYKERDFQTLIDVDSKNGIIFHQEIPENISNFAIFIENGLFQMFEFNLNIQSDQWFMIEQRVNHGILQCVSVVMLSEQTMDDLILQSDNKKLNYELISINDVTGDDLVSNVSKSVQSIVNSFKIQSLAGVHYLLPHQFSTSSLSLFITQLTGESIKRNNVYRYYGSFLKTVCFDRSKPGRPERIMTYQKNN